MNLLKLKHSNHLWSFSCALLSFLLASSALAQTPLNGGWITGVTALASSEQVPGYNGAFRTTSDEGLTETAPGSGLFQLSNTAVGWTSKLPEENAVIHFDLGSVQTVDRFRVWNYNEPNFNFRSFRQMTFQWSNDAQVWQTSPQRFPLVKAPATSTYTGELLTLTWPVTARYIRLWCDDTHRQGGTREQCGLSRVRFYAGGTPAAPPTSDGIFPAGARVINVKSPPYSAIADGIADDSATLQQAIADHEGTMATLYFPAGTYRLSQPLRMRKNAEPPGQQRNGFLAFRGESMATTILKLDNNVLTNASLPEAVVDLGYFNSPGAQGGVAADWYQINFNHFTIHTGTGNPGAIGLRFYANNIGIARDLIIRSGDGQGVYGLDCGAAGLNGPNLVKNLRVEGFAVGIHTLDAINSQVFENIELINQTQLGWRNNAQILSIHHLRSQGSVPVLESNAYFAHVVLIDAILTGVNVPASTPAINNQGMLLARDVSTPGFPLAIQNQAGISENPASGTTVSSPIAEYTTHARLKLFPSTQSTLRLPIEETPIPSADPPAIWVNARNYRLTTESDIGPALQRAIDTGAGTVYLPRSYYYLRSAVQLRSSLKRLNLFFSTVAKGDPTAALELAAGSAPVVSIEDISEAFLGAIPVRVNAPRSLAVRNTQGLAFAATVPGAKLYLENNVSFELDLSVGTSAWARQLNLESNAGPSIMLRNKGGNAWILGYKTEGRSTLATTTTGGLTELLGGLNYSGFTPSGTPMFVIEDSSATLNIAEVNFVGQPFNPAVRETRAGVTLDLNNSQTPGAVGGPRLALFSSAHELVTNTISKSGATTTITWASIPGRRYRVEWSDSLTLNTWMALPAMPVTATTGQYSRSITDTTPAPSGRRFYRTVLLNE
jgi:hypothetical protein